MPRKYKVIAAIILVNAISAIVIVLTVSKLQTNKSVAPNAPESQPRAQTTSTTPMACTAETNQVINFESVPGSTTHPPELAPINTQYQHITFRNGPRLNALTGQNMGACSTQYPLLAKRGSPRVAFLNDATGVADAPNAAANAGIWFLTDDGLLDGSDNKQPCSLIVDYSIPTTQLSFELIDIDNAEGWQIEPYDINGNLITSLVKRVNYQSSGTGDSVGTIIKIISTNALPISQIQIKAYGTSTGWGLAFDNFSTFCAIPPSPTPTPTDTPTPTITPTSTPTSACTINVPITIVTPTPSASPTPTPTLPPAPQCTGIKIYDRNFNQITLDQVSKLDPGGIINLAVTGAGGNFDKARFFVNGVLLGETTTTVPGNPQEFYISYTIPSGVTNFAISAELHDASQDIWY